MRVLLASLGAISFALCTLIGVVKSARLAPADPMRGRTFRVWAIAGALLAVSLFAASFIFPDPYAL